MPKFIAVCLDETSSYNFDPEDVPFIDKMLGAYVYDPEERTHLCEFTPSYWLERLYCTALLKADVSDEVKGRIYDRYELNSNSEAGIYMHCSDIERLSAEDKHDAGEFEDLEEARDYLSSNCPF